jgi:HIRAN domain
MSESLIPVTPGLLDLLRREGQGIVPFSQEILVLEIVVAGTSYCAEIESIESCIVPEKFLTMKREPDNKFDKFAIALYCDDTRIGFVPAATNQVCSRLMDAGKLFVCRVVAKNWIDTWLQIDATISMVD